MTLLYLFVCLVMAGFFAGMETGLLAVNRMLIQSKCDDRVLFARTTEFLLRKPERLLGTTLIGHNIANVTGAVLVTNYFESIGREQYTWIGIIATTLVFLVFDDFIPKSFLRQHANTIAARLSPMLVLFYCIFFVPYLVLNTLVKVLLVVTGMHRAHREELRTRRDLRFLVNLTGKEAGLPTADQRIIEDILHFRDQIAREVMIPFYKLPVLTAHQELVDVVRISVENGQRFLPVSRHRTDNMIGYIDTSELIATSTQTVEQALREAEYYPETIRLPDLLLDMNRRRIEVAFLVDEYGAIAGMITPNQIVADVVHYTPEDGSFEADIERVQPGKYRVDGETDLEDLCHELGTTLSASVNSTVGGFLCERLGCIPDLGATYDEAGYRFSVVDRTSRAVRTVEIDHIHRSHHQPSAEAEIGTAAHEAAEQE